MKLLKIRSTTNKHIVFRVWNHEIGTLRGWARRRPIGWARRILGSWDSIFVVLKARACGRDGAGDGLVNEPGEFLNKRYVSWIRFSSKLDDASVVLSYASRSVSHNSGGCFGDNNKGARFEFFPEAYLLKH